MTRKNDTGTELEPQTDNNESENPYEVLGIPKTATDNMIKTAFRKLASRWHPDKHTQVLPEHLRAFQRAREAYEFLLNPVKRREYDATGKMPDTDEQIQTAAKASVMLWVGRACDEYVAELLDDDDDIVLEAVRKAMEFVVEKKADLKEAKRKHKKLTKLIKRFTKRTPEFERTIVHDMLQKKLEQELGQIVEAEQELEILKVAIPMIRDYTYFVADGDEDDDDLPMLGHAK